MTGLHYVRALMSGGLRLWVFAQGAFGPGAYVKRLMAWGLCLGVFCRRGLGVRGLCQRALCLTAYAVALGRRCRGSSEETLDRLRPTTGVSVCEITPKGEIHTQQRRVG